MLDLNHPRTPIIFQASAYTDRIKNNCGRYTVAAFEQRRQLFLDMKVHCDELTAFCKIHFKKNAEAINRLADEIKLETEKLEVVDNDTDEGKCNVCNGNLFKYKSYVKEWGHFYYCDNCPKQIVALCNRIDQLTDAWFI
jgi:hypothetical protein